MNSSSLFGLKGPYFTPVWETGIENRTKLNVFRAILPGGQDQI